MVDAFTGDIYGVLVAGSAIMQEGYLIPACDVTDDILKSTKSHELRVPTMNDALCLASQYGNVDLVKSLITAGVVVNENLGSKESSKALSGAAEYGELEVMKILLSKGARFDEQGGQQYGPTAVLAAKRSGDSKLMKDLIYAGAQAYTSQSGSIAAPKVKGEAYAQAYSVDHPGKAEVDNSRLSKWFKTAITHEQRALGTKVDQEGKQIRLDKFDSTRK